MNIVKALEISGGAGMAILAAILGNWQITVAILCLWAICMLANLVLGILAAVQAGTYSSAIAHKAYLKKAGVVILMVVFILLDWVILAFAPQFGIAYTFPLISSMMIGYQIVHEVASVIENSKKLGNSIPTFIETGVNAAGNAFDKGQIPTAADLTKGEASASDTTGAE